jgi:hypothetical protein
MSRMCSPGSCRSDPGLRLCMCPCRQGNPLRLPSRRLRSAAQRSTTQHTTARVSTRQAHHICVLHRLHPRISTAQYRRSAMPLRCHCQVGSASSPVSGMPSPTSLQPFCRQTTQRLDVLLHKALPTTTCRSGRPRVTPESTAMYCTCLR